MVGWVKVHRELEEHWIWTEKPFSKGQAWIDLIMHAQFSEERKKISIKGKLYGLKRGQQARSEQTLAKTWGWSRGKIRRFLTRLKDEQMIVQHSDNKTSIITILNYDKYQSTQTALDTADGTALDTATVQHPDSTRYTIEEGKKVTTKVKDNIADSVPKSANLNEDENGQKNEAEVDQRKSNPNSKLSGRGATGESEPRTGTKPTQPKIPLGHHANPGNGQNIGDSTGGDGPQENMSVPGSSAVVCDGDSPGGRGRDNEQVHGHVRRGNSKGDDKGNPGKLDSGPRYRTSRKKWLSGQRLKDFEQFWQVFGDKRGKPGAAQSWLDLEDYGPELVKYILHGAKRYCHDREDIKSTGGTPKMAQGWLTDRRWEDYPVESDRSKKPTRTREQIKAEVYAKYGRKDLQAAATGTNGKVSTGNIVGDGSSPPGPALQILFGG